MPAGLEVKNTWGDLQVFNDGLFLRLMTKLTFTSGGWVTDERITNAKYRTFDVPAGLVAPLICIHSPNVGCWYDYTPILGPPSRHRIMAQNPQTGPIEVFIFDSTPPPPRESGAGLQLFRPGGGVLAFDSEVPVARPVGMLTSGTYNGDAVTGKKLAFSPIKRSTAGSAFEQNFGGPEWYADFYWEYSMVRAGVGAITDSLLEIHQWQLVYNQQRGIDFTAASPARQSLIIDVTGL